MQVSDEALKEEIAELRRKTAELQQKLQQKEKDLQQKEKQLEELSVELNAELRKHQGDFGDAKSADDVGREYCSLFTADVLKALQGVQGKQNKIEAREQLCHIFQEVYLAVSRYLVKQVTEKLSGMFELQGAVDEATANDMKRAYARLLSAANLTGRHLDTKIQDEIHSEIQEVLGTPSLVSSADKHQFVIKAIDIAWSLVTAVPPLIPSCDECTFHDDLHEKSIYWDDECQTNYKIKYIRPVLYTNSLGAITQKGSVRNAKLDEEKSTTSIRPDSSNVSELMRPATPPPFAVGEKVMAKVSQGFKLAIVKFIGETEFAPGEWIGVAFKHPIGKNNGTVNGVQYFKCKDKHGLFVQKDKITVCPSSLLSSPVKKKPSTLSHSQRTNPSLLERGRNQQGAVTPRSTRGLSPASRAEAKKRGPSPTASAGKRTPPLTPTTDFESTSISESTKQTTPTEPPPFAVGESVIVETRQGFKLATVKFIGETKFAPGEWIGVAFARPIGKNNGTVNGVQYFRCKDKRGKFIQRDKIIPASSPTII